MRVVEPYKPEIRILGRKGVVHATFESELQAYAWAKQSGLMGYHPLLGLEFGPYDEFLSGFNPPHYVVEDEFGTRLNLEKHRPYRQWWLRPGYGNYLYRCMPVPFTGKRGRRRWFRHPATRGEARDISGAEQELREVGFRTHQVARVRELPDSWSDIQPRVQRNWKEQRRTRWKS